MTATRRADFMRALEAGVEANRELRKTLQWGERQTRRILREMETGSSLAEIAEHIDLGGIRERITEALNQLERTRHAVRVTSYAMAQEEQLSIGYLSGVWGISRQRGQQYAHEARDGARP